MYSDGVKKNSRESQVKYIDNFLNPQNNTHTHIDQINFIKFKKIFSSIK